MIIDVHTHIMSPEIAAAKTVYLARDRWFDECYRDPKARFATAESLVASMHTARITRAVVTGFAFADPGLCAASNDYIIEAVRRFPDRLIGLAAVQPNGGDAAVYELERCLKAGLSGGVVTGRPGSRPGQPRNDAAPGDRFTKVWCAPYDSHQRTGRPSLPR